MGAVGPYPLATPPIVIKVHPDRMSAMVGREGWILENLHRYGVCNEDRRLKICLFCIRTIWMIPKQHKINMTTNRERKSKRLLVSQIIDHIDETVETKMDKIV